MLAIASTATIFSIFMFCWTFIMARDPKTWRLWFMALFGIIDMKSTREERRRSESQLSIISWILCVIFFIGIIGSVYIIFLELQEEKSQKTQFEKDQEKTMKDIEKWRSKFKKLR
jgi:preprotein translocase subunit SecG